MGLVTPDFGLLFWMLVSFSLLLYILKRYAWKPILNALKERDNSIENALNAAEEAKKEMMLLQSRNEDLLKEAIIEREKIVKEARELKESILRDAKSQAIVEANKVMDNAKAAIEQEKAGAILEIKKVIATYSIEIAEKILQERLSDDKQQKELVNSYIKNISIN
jgi:F-type H+-transporting ATPase subunit b